MQNAQLVGGKYLVRSNYSPIQLTTAWEIISWKANIAKCF